MVVWDQYPLFVLESVTSKSTLVSAGTEQAGAILDIVSAQHARAVLGIYGLGWWGQRLSCR